MRIASAVAPLAGVLVTVVYLGPVRLALLAYAGGARWACAGWSREVALGRC